MPQGPSREQTRAQQGEGHSVGGCSWDGARLHTSGPQGCSLLVSCQKHLVTHGFQRSVWAVLKGNAWAMLGRRSGAYCVRHADPHALLKEPQVCVAFGSLVVTPLMVGHLVVYHLQSNQFPPVKQGWRFLLSQRFAILS